MNYRLLLFVLVLFSACKTTSISTDQTTAYIGTYTRAEGHVNGQAQGIYSVSVDPVTGKMSNTQPIATLTNPSFLKKSADGKFVYAVSELAQDDEPTGFIHAFRVGGKKLTEISKLPTDGKAPCHVEIDKTGQFVIASNYVGGVAKMYRIVADGSLTVTDKFAISDAVRDGVPSWLHSANISPDNRLVAIADKGMDRIWLFMLDVQNGKLIPHDQVYLQTRKGAGPRHAEWSANGKYLYLINELDNTVNVIGYDKGNDRFSILQTITTLPEGFTETSYGADIHLHPNGKFLYGSNRGHNSIAMYKVDTKSGLLESIGHEPTRGTYPRNFAISGNGEFLYAANQNSNSIAVYTIGSSGKLAFTGQNFEIGTPVCVAF
ncbi:MAG: 6-phosphogluconolactonase [Neolewinella sp.]|jgi:6-phosphogluconolactonase